MLASAWPDHAIVLGKRYELSGWIRTEGLEVRDLDRSPIADRRDADHGVDAFRCALGFAWRNAAVDSGFARFRRQPRRRIRFCSRPALAVRLG